MSSTLNNVQRGKMECEFFMLMLAQPIFWSISRNLEPIIPPLITGVKE